MPAIGSLLSIARSGLMASQAHIATASQNITNAQTPGYSRQRTLIRQGDQQNLPFGNFGTGVIVDGTERIRDNLLDTTFRRDAGAAAYNEQRRDALQAVESVYGEPSSTGLASTLDQFWQAWSDLANNPTSNAARAVVRTRGEQVASQLNAFGNQVIDAHTNTRTRLLNATARVNTLAEQVATLNGQIVAAEAAGNQSPDLRDQRDQRIDELSKLIGATAWPQANGSVNVNIGGDSLVDGNTFTTARLQAPLNDPSKLSIALGPANTSNTPIETLYSFGGEIGGLADAYNTVYPNALTELDTIAAALVTEINAVHTTGFVGAAPAGNFFAAGFASARDIRLDPAITNNLANIAASGISGEAGDNGIALRMSQMRTTAVVVGSQSVSIGEGYRNLVSRNAVAVSAASGTADAARTLATQTDARRDSVKGVSIDEEMVTLMKFQQSYQAAARLVSVVDEISQTLINLGR
jgi:flagellar hook-associated protein 1